MDGRILAERYRLRAVIGRGGSSTVYEADHLALGNQIAVKVLDARRVRGEALARFLREAEALTRLVHPAAVRVFDRGETDDGYVWLAMERLAGETLEARLARGPLYPGELVDLFRPLCEVLEEAHAKGIVHRDLKPANVMLVPTPAGGVSPKLFDFGIATLRGDDGLTDPDLIGGTPRYMAPEQWQGLAHADAHADVYSLGVIAYQCLSGELPFAAEGALAWMNKHRYEAPRDLAAAMGDRPLPAGMGAAVMRTLAKRPEDRPGSAMALWRALAAGLDAAVRGDDDGVDADVTDDVAGAPALTAAMPPAPLPARPTRRRVLTWAIPTVAATSALGAGLAWRWWRRGGGGACPPLPATYMPLTVGSWWRYRVLDPTTLRARGEKQISLDRAGPIAGAAPGVTGVRMNRVDPEGSAVRWLARAGDAVVWHHDQWFDSAGALTRDVRYRPWRLRVDDGCAHRQVGARWVHEHDRLDLDVHDPARATTTRCRDAWSIEAIDERVEVPAGEFRTLRLRLHRTEGDTELIATYWFAPGVGKVREDSRPKEIEELLAYEVAR